MEGVTVIGTSYSASPSLLTFFNNTDEVASMMKVFMIFQANLNWATTAIGEEYFQRFRSWPATVSYMNGQPVCRNHSILLHSG